MKCKSIWLKRCLIAFIYFQECITLPKKQLTFDFYIFSGNEEGPGAWSHKRGKSLYQRFTLEVVAPLYCHYTGDFKVISLTFLWSRKLHPQVQCFLKWLSVIKPIISNCCNGIIDSCFLRIYDFIPTSSLFATFDNLFFILMHS